MCAAAGIDMRRDDICLYLNPADRAKLEEIVANRNSPRKWVWRAEIVLATADGLGTNAIMRRAGKSKPCVWRWQERYIDDGLPGLLRDKTRPSRIAPLSAEKKLVIIEKTATEKPANATHWSARKMAKAIGVSVACNGCGRATWAGRATRPRQSQPGLRQADMAAIDRGLPHAALCARRGPACRTPPAGPDAEWGRGVKEAFWLPLLRSGSKVFSRSFPSSRDACGAKRPFGVKIPSLPQRTYLQRRVGCLGGRHLLSK
jgi:transposase